MQNPRLTTFPCNICGDAEGIVLLDCYCLFCSKCFILSGIEKDLTEKLQCYRKGERVEKCSRCKRNTEFQIRHLDQKSDFDRSKTFFADLTKIFMQEIRAFEFQTLQRNRQIEGLKTKLERVYQKIGKLVSDSPQFSRYFDEEEMKYVKVADEEANNDSSLLEMRQMKSSKQNSVFEQIDPIENIIDPFLFLPKQPTNLEKYEPPMSVIHSYSNDDAESSYRSKGKGKGPEQRPFREELKFYFDQMLMENPGNKDKTSIASQLKKIKIEENQDLLPEQREEMQRSFGFNAKEDNNIKSRPTSTDKGGSFQ